MARSKPQGDAENSSKTSASDGPPPSNADSISQLVCEQVRQLRKKRSWTLEQLANVSGVSRSMLSQIERGAANPTLGVAHRIAVAFGLSLGDLVAGSGRPAQIDVIRSNDSSALFRDDGEVRIRTLSPLNLEKDAEFYEVMLRPGAVLRSQPHFQGTREFLTIEKGTVRLTAGDQSCELAPGDSAHYPADVAHTIENVGRGEALAFLVDLYERA